MTQKWNSYAEDIFSNKLSKSLKSNSLWHKGWKSYAEDIFSSKLSKSLKQKTAYLHIWMVEWWISIPKEMESYSQS